MSLRRLFLAMLAPALAAGAPLKVDFSIPDRRDSLAPDYEQWLLTPADSARKVFGAITVTVARSGPAGTGLEAVWWKGGAYEPARMAADGITVTGPGAEQGAQLELRFSGLAPGPHTLATFHSTSMPEGPVEAARLDVSVDGGRQVTGLIPSHRVTHDDDAASAWLEFTAEAGRDVVVLLASDRNIVLCGFELDGPHPGRRARRPSPADRDEHLAADHGAATLAWTAPPAAVAYQVYVGRTRAAVEAATTASPEFRGKPTSTSHELSGLTPHEDCFWRVDAIDAQDRITRGRTWRFRIRRLAFPGAEGYGRFARGGRGGRVLEVTNLNDSGPGSLRAAVEAEGPRTVVFDVSGLITLESKLIIRNPYLTVAGQTAPGSGITLRKFTFGMIGSHDVIVRHVRVRPGDISGVTLDGMGMSSSDHSIYDHCSISWTIDEAFSSRGAKNITLQRTLIAEALNVAGHRNYPPGSQHGYAASIGGMVGSFHHNLLAHNSGRNWSLAGGLDQAGRHTAWLDLRNNVVYNWQNRTTDGGAARVMFVNNYYQPGPASKVFHLLKPERNNIAGFGPQDYFVAGNIMAGRVGADDPLGGVVPPTPPRQRRRSGDGVLDLDDAPAVRAEPLSSFIKDTPFFEPHVTTQSAAAAYKIVLSDVGANQPRADAQDTRIIGETLSGTTHFRGSKSGLPGLPDSQADVGGWEKHPEEHRPAGWDTDHDGMPDWWEKIHGLDARSPAGNFAEGNADPDGDGFTRLEDYLAWMAEPNFECAAGASIDIDLGALTRGFTDRPVFTLAPAHGGTVSLQPDSRTARFVPATRSPAIARFTFTVTDAAGDTMTRQVNIRVP
ncbi:MAG TPA: hypothetical protein VHN79_01305 [Lacunisphaera sp.]|nr:hypothetical protein [Lacunisphaera sp.]